MEILGQRFADGLLPSESELMLEYRAGRNIVRAALASLQRDRYIVRVQGAGTFVVNRKLSHRTTAALGIAGSARASEHRAVSRVVASNEVAATGRVARELDVAEGTPCGAYDVLLTIDELPCVLMTSYLPVHSVPPGLDRYVLTNEWPGDWYDALDDIGLEIAGRQVSVEAILADPLVAPLLEVESGDPLLHFERRLLGGSGQVIEYGFSYCRGDRLAVLFEERTGGSR
jgi:GntR family transcriptional regulator